MPFSPAGPAALLPPCIAAGPVRYICVSPGTRLADGTFRAKLTAGSVFMKGGYDMKWTDVLIRMGLALVIGMGIGVERETKNRPAGLRTHILVCLGACVIALIESTFIAGVTSDMPDGVNISFGRMTAQVISGIGFLGAGTILMSNRRVTGLTTAASVWNTACLGLAEGYGYHAIALSGAVIVLLVLIVLHRVVHISLDKKVVISFVNRAETIEMLNAYFKENKVFVLEVDYHVSNEDGQTLCTGTYALRLPHQLTYSDMVNHLAEYRDIMSILTTTV